MPELIEREAFVKHLRSMNREFVDPIGKAWNAGVSAAISTCEKFPALDVVSCGECVNWEKERKYCRHPAGLSYCGRKAETDGFCCFGEQRGEARNEPRN